MKENAVKDKSFAFALRIVKLYQFLSEERREYVLSRQLLRSGTAIGAYFNKILLDGISENAHIHHIDFDGIPLTGTIIPLSIIHYQFSGEKLGVIMKTQYKLIS